jgi:hypothetical protein
MSEPVLPDAYRDANDWVLVEETREQALELPFFAITAFNAVYGDAAILDTADYTATDVHVPVRAVFTSGLTFDPPLSWFGVDPGSKRVYPIGRRYARREFATSIREDGLADVARVGSRTFQRPDGPTAYAWRYETGYPLDPEALLEENASGTILVAADVWAGIWPTRDDYAMAGGIYPTETFADAVARQAPGGTLAVDVDLDVDPARDEERVFDAMQAVE